MLDLKERVLGSTKMIVLGISVLMGLAGAAGMSAAGIAIYLTMKELDKSQRKK